MVFLTTVTTVTAVTTVILFSFSFSILPDKAIWQIWHPIWCSQGSVLQFSQCFVERLHAFCVNFFAERLQDFFVERLRDFCVWRGCMIFVCEEVAYFFCLKRFCSEFIFLEVLLFFCGAFAWFFCREIAWFFVWRGCMIFCLKRLRYFLCEEVFKWKKFSVEILFLGEKNFLGHYCHYCHDCHYCPYSNYCQIGRLVVMF